MENAKTYESLGNTCTFGFTDCGSGSNLKYVEESNTFVLAFDNDGDQVLFTHLRHWQLELLTRQIGQMLKKYPEEEARPDPRTQQKKQ